MLTRARTALLLAGLSLAGPCQAELALDQETAAVLLAPDAATPECDIAFGCQDLSAGESSAAQPATDVAVLAPAPDLTEPRAEHPSIMESLDAAELALSPERFLDPDEDETFALIAKDLAAAGDLVTGSLPSIAPDESGSPAAIDASELAAAAEAAAAFAPDSPAVAEPSIESGLDR